MALWALFWRGGGEWTSGGECYEVELEFPFTGRLKWTAEAGAGIWPVAIHMGKRYPVVGPWKQ